MSDVSAVLSLPYILPAQAQKHVTHNEALARLDIAVQLAVIARDAVLPPPGALTGDRYLVPAGAQNEWAGHAGEIALMDGGTWVFHAPVAGWTARVLAEDIVLRFDGTGWLEGQGALQADSLGIGTAADAVNRLAVASPATLLSHAGAGHQVKINKADATETASLLFQTGWSGRAEMGTAGSDAFAIKVSADGAAWTTALSVDPASGHVTGAAVQAGPGDTTPGRLARADYAYGPGNLLGAVAQEGGQPTGAAIERGQNANGQYTRLADGTQICTHSLNSGDSAPVAWVYPAAFAAPPALSLAAGAASARIVTYQSAGPTSVSVNGFTTSGSRAVFTVSLTAIGRWF